MIFRRAIGPMLGAAVVTALAFLLDPWVWRHLAYPTVYEHDWGRLLRVMGSMVLWLPLTVAVWLESRARQPRTAGQSWLLLIGPAAAGILAEILKLFLRRERPNLHNGEYVYRGFADRPFDTRDFGLPSSHAMVAFAGATVLARRYPHAAPAFYLLAAGCGLSRVIAQAHFLSDALTAGIAGWAVASWLCRRFMSPDS
jgi:membrane-associated phospholipid phosphatase